MKRYLNMAVMIAVMVFIITSISLGIRLSEFDYDIIVESYVLAGCLIVVCGNAVYTAISVYVNNILIINKFTRKRSVVI